MASARGFREIAYFDVKGGGQVIVDGTTAYVGHTVGPEGTTIIDVGDPKNPRRIAQLQCRHQGVHAHKVRVQNGLMLTNYEARSYVGDAETGFRGGLNIWDVSDPVNPRHIHFWECAGCGVHRFTYDGRYAYISPEMDGYVGAIVVILDLKDPTRPEEVGRWWYPGQWTAGGEKPAWKDDEFRCHHPMRLGNRLYTSYWHGGFVILDVDDMTRPKFISGLDWSPPFAFPTHTCLPIPFEIQGEKWMVVADEDAARLWKDTPGAMLWMVNISDEKNPVPVSTVQLDDGPTPPRSGCHQPAEDVKGTEIPVAWFAKGLQMVDISNPYAMKVVAHFTPDPPPGQKQLMSNDVCWDERGLIYLIDRDRGLHIVERA
jgi:hypothetical protein